MPRRLTPQTATPVTDTSPLRPDELNKFWAVVLDPYRQSEYWITRVLWRGDLETWVPSAGPYPGFLDRPHPVAPEFNPDDIRRVRQALHSMKHRPCQHRPLALRYHSQSNHPWSTWGVECGQGIDQHFIAPGRDGLARVYCVQQPDPTVVASRGGGGNKKHHGGPTGCHSVEETFWSGTRYDEEVPVYNDGEGLSAGDVRDLAWCDRCHIGPDDDARYFESDKRQVEQRQQARKRRR